MSKNFSYLKLLTSMDIYEENMISHIEFFSILAFFLSLKKINHKAEIFMRKISFLFIMLTVGSTLLWSQTILKGIVKTSDTNNPLPGVRVTLLKQNISTQTNAEGEFMFSYIDTGNDELSFFRTGYLTQIKLIYIKAETENDAGTFMLKPDLETDLKQDVVLQLSESQLIDDDSRIQNISGALNSRDVYTSQTSFAFSPMRFQMRGYDNTYETTYINGVHFNSLERGVFNYSGLGGLNDAMRNREEVNGLMTNTFSYGNIGSTTNINTRATNYAAGVKTSVAYSNRMYKLRAQSTYATGLMQNGWAFAASGVVRWSDKGIVDGTFYNSAGYFLSAEKVFNPQHSLSLVTFGAPTQRAQSSAVTQEVYDLAGSIYYNSYWGYQEGKMRNSRVVKSFDPTVILAHDFKIDEKQRIRTGIGYHYSFYSNSALTFYNAPDPRPDYYRYLPSFQTDSSLAGNISEMWKTDTKVSQINWDELYRRNALNNERDPNSIAKYAVERRHNNLVELALNSHYTNQISKSLKLSAGIEAKASKGIHFKTMDDLMGGNQWIDIDQFAERDFPTNPNVIQNDLNNPNRIIKKGDIFGYNYDVNIKHLSAYVKNEWNLPQLDIFYAAKITYTEFYRFGHMLNGRAEAVNAQSYGKGKVWYTTNPSIKGGLTYKIDGRNRLYINGLMESRAPQVNNAYVSVRIKDTAVPLQNEGIVSSDINYSFNYRGFRGRITGFFTQINHTGDLYGYYDDENQTFVKFLLSGLNKQYSGVEAGVELKLNSNFSISAAGTYSDYRYTNNSTGIKSYENGKFADSMDSVMTKNMKIAAGPQLAANITLDYFHPKMWFADITLNYFDNNYLDFAPNRFTKKSLGLYVTEEMKKTLGTQEKLSGGFMLDASLGKLFYLKDRRSLNFNLSASNILNNTKMITGGFQQARLPLNDKVIDVNALNKFPNKYYYAWGFNVFLNIGYKF